MKLYDGQTFTRGELTFTVQFEHDETMGHPWDEHDGHGPVRESRTRHSQGGDKRPGERPLNSPDRGEYQYYYDWQGATRLARRDGWGHPDGLQAAVQADFDYCRRYLAGDWHWTGVIVTCEETGGTESLWGIEDTDGTYCTEVAFELADELVRQHERALAIAAKEADEVRYWAARDVMTVGGAACSQ